MIGPGHIRDGLYGLKDPTNSVKAPKEDKFHGLGFNPKKVHPTHRVIIIRQMCRMKKKHKIQLQPASCTIHLHEKHYLLVQMNVWEIKAIEKQMLTI